MTGSQESGHSLVTRGAHSTGLCPARAELHHRSLYSSFFSQWGHHCLSWGCGEDTNSGPGESVLNKISLVMHCNIYFSMRSTGLTFHLNQWTLKIKQNNLSSIPSLTSQVTVRLGFSPGSLDICQCLMFSLPYLASEVTVLDLTLLCDWLKIKQHLTFRR
jgi:hypothetical protein